MPTWSTSAYFGYYGIVLLMTNVSDDAIRLIKHFGQLLINFYRRRIVLDLHHHAKLIKNKV